MVKVCKCLKRNVNNNLIIVLVYWKVVSFNNTFRVSFVSFVKNKGFDIYSDMSLNEISLNEMSLNEMSLNEISLNEIFSNFKVVTVNIRVWCKYKFKKLFGVLW
jgi:hypothetical protein